MSANQLLFIGAVLFCPIWYYWALKNCSEDSKRRTAWIVALVLPPIAAIGGFVFSYFMQPGLFTAFVSFEKYVEQVTSLLEDLDSREARSEIARTMFYWTLGGAGGGLLVGLIILRDVKNTSGRKDC